MTGPELLLLDEPMAGVTPVLREQLLEHILDLRRESGITFLLVEHDMDVVMRASDRVIVLANGRVICEGTPDEVRSRPGHRCLPRTGALSEPLLEAEGIEAGYGAALVLHGVHGRAAAGEIVSIIGPNGAGKSTLLKALYGLVRPAPAASRSAAPT